MTKRKKFEDIKRVIGSRNSKGDRQSNDKPKKDKKKKSLKISKALSETAIQRGTCNAMIKRKGTK